MGRSDVRKIGGGSLRDLKARINALPTSVAHDVAQRAAPVLTALARNAYQSGVNVFGDPWPVGANGQPVTLYQTGRTERSLTFVANGSILRCVLGENYQRYLIGKYKILPNGDRSAMPAAWSAALNKIVAEAQRAGRAAA